MDLTLIDIFLTIVEMRSISAAAEKLYLSQPTISNRLAKLEESLGGTLIHRGQGIKTITLTPKGEEFIAFAKRYESLKKDIDTWKKDEPKYLLKIASPSSINAYLLTELFHVLINKKYPLNLKITSHWNETVYSMMESYDLDIGIVSRRFDSRHVITSNILKEQMVFISNVNSSNYADYLHPNDLDVVNEIFLDWGENYNSWHDIWFAPDDKMHYFIDTPALISRFLLRENAWAVVPMSVANQLQKESEIKISKSLEPIPYRVIYLVEHRYPKPGSLEILDIFKKELDDFIKTNPYIINI